MRILAAGAVATVLLIGGGCFTPLAEGQRMQSQILRLQASVQAMEEQQAEAKAAQKADLAEGLARIDAKLAEVSRAMGALGLSARKNDADFGATLDGMLAEIQKLRGEVEELKHRNGLLEQGLADTRTEVQTKLDASATAARAEIEALKGDEAVAKLQSKTKAKRLAEKGERKKLLDMAEGRLKEGEHAFAREIVKDYLARWPEDPMAGGAQLLLAETFFRSKEYRPAILEYNRFRERYPEHPLMPGALFNIGESFVALGLKPEAGKFYDVVIKRFKKSDTAGRARKRKKELKIK